MNKDITHISEVHHFEYPGSLNMYEKVYWASDELSHKSSVILNRIRNSYVAILETDKVEILALLSTLGTGH